MSQEIDSTFVTNTWEILLSLYGKNNVPAPSWFAKHTKDCCKRFSIVKCLTSKIVDYNLKDVFIPLTLTSSKKSREHYRVAGFNSPLFDAYKRVLIVDTVGMGKSTLVKQVYLDIVQKGLGLPIFVELRRLSRNYSIIDAIVDQLTFSPDHLSKNVFFQFVEDGDFIFILDGYDEIHTDDKESVLTDLRDFMSLVPNNRFIMTSRQDPSLTFFNGFETFYIEKLNKEEAAILLQNYDDSKDKDVSIQLIAELESSSEYDEFLGSPLLVSMLLTTFSYKNEIPRQKHDFYRLVFDAYYNSHDLTKGESYQHTKKSKLGIEEFHRVLRYIGLVCLKKDRLEFKKDDMTDTISKALRLSETKCSVTDFFSDILYVVPVFVKEGEYYRWAQEALFDYFVAQFIYQDAIDKEGLLKELTKSERIDKYNSVLDIYYDIDYSSFRHLILKDLFQQFVEYVEDGGGLTSSIVRRRQCAFCCDEYYMVYLQKNDDGFFNNIIFKLSQETGFNAWEHESNKATTFFAIRKWRGSRNAILVDLLQKKGHNCIHSGNQSPILTPIGLDLKQYYRLTNDLANPLNKRGMYNITTKLMEAFPFIEYNKVKAELRSMEEDKNNVIAFETSLFS